MKKVICTLAALVCLGLVTIAQFDERFYFPSTTVRPIDSSLKVEHVTLRTDTVTLTGIFLTPNGKPKATVYFLHGAGGNVASYLYMARPLLDSGYQVFMIDFRGYGKSTGKPTHLNIAKDGQLVMDYLLKRADVKDTKVIVFGASIGTQVATKLARDNQDKIAALVLEGTMSSFPDIAAFYAPKEQQPMIRQALAVPYGAKIDIPFITKIPVLVVHGKEDKEVPFEMSETIFNAAVGAKELWAPGGGHLQAMKLFPAEFVQRIGKLIR